MGGAVELFDEAVIAAASAHPGLGAQVVAGELEHGAGVVVEAAHEGGVDLIADARVIEEGSHGGEVLGVLGRQAVQEAGRRGHHLLRAAVAGVKGPHRVQLDALAYLAGQRVAVRAQVGGELLAVLGPRLRRAEAAQAQAGPHSDGFEQLGQEDDELGVGLGRGRADGLRPHLPELAVATALGGLGAVEAAQVPELHRLGQLVHAVLDVGAADRGGALRAQRQGPPGAVVEAVHLLADDVGRLAHSAGEELGGFESRGLDAAVAGRLEDAPGMTGERLAAGSIVSQHIEGALRGLQHQRWASSRKNGLVSRSRPSVVTPM